METHRADHSASVTVTVNSSATGVLQENTQYNYTVRAHNGVGVALYDSASFGKH